MTARNRSRTFLVGAAVAALFAPLALVAALANPASAAPGKPHEVYMYKVEQHVDLSGEFPDQFVHTHVYCNPGDLALDGMWRVDHVDQANPPDTVGDERDVYVHASYGDDVDRSKWHFRLTNFADGDAQIKLFVTCIRGYVEQAYGHTHQVVLSSRNDDLSHTGGGALAAGSQSFTHSFTCPTGTVAVAPGFNFLNNERAHIFRSWPTADFRGWQWAFLVEDPNTEVTVYLSCLQIKTGPGGNGPHAHNLQWAWRPNGFAGDHQSLDVVGTQERRINCDDGADGKFFQDYKAMVGAFWINDPFHVWFLGMDPRPKQRSYKFWWDGSGDNNIYLGALCIRARTGKQVAP